MPEEFRTTAFDLLLASMLMYGESGRRPTAFSSCSSAQPTVFIEKAAFKMIVAYLVENFCGFYYRGYIGYYPEGFETVHTGHYIEPSESVRTI